MEILYEDDHIVAVDKPSGVFVHKSLLAEPGARFALQEVRELTGKMVNPVHRIDRATSGVLIFAFTKEATRILCDSFLNRDVQKEYIAVVRGWTGESDTIDYPLAPEPGKEKQEAITCYQLLGKKEFPFPVRPYETSRYSLVHVTLETGRPHQIRRHFKHIFHPILGDTTYGDGHHNKSMRDQLHIHRLMLFCQRITLPHPVTGETIVIEGKLPEEFPKMFPSSGN